MTASDTREAQRRRTLAALAAILCAIERDYTETERQTAALALGREDVIPEPQLTLFVKRCIPRSAV
jgi:hypothetical protein